MVPQQVADGVAQLTVRDLGGVLLAVNGDETCGFSSAAVIDNPSIAGEVGETGTVTYTVTDCAIDLGSEPVDLKTDCNDITTAGTGAVTVTARKIVTGRLTGDPETPVIPEEPDAASFVIDQATFVDFDVTKTGSDSHMRIVDGSLSATITPMLAVDVENGACSVLTPHIAFSDITWGASTVSVTSGKREFEVPIANGSLDAVNGTIGEHENWVEGSLTVWKKTKDVLLEGPTEGLDPDYDAQLIEDSYTCNPELAQPVSFSCDLDPKLAEGAARLIVKNFGLVTKTTDLDTDCGFGNLMEQVSGLISIGALTGLFTGDPETIEINADACALGGDMFPIIEDCVGTEYFLDGNVVVTGTKTVTGKVVLSTNPLQPQDRESAVVEIDQVLISEATPLELPPGASDYEPHLTMHNGTLSGTYNPITGEAADTPGAYFVVIPVGGFEGVRLQNAEVTLHQGAMRFPMRVDDSDLYAFTGAYQDESNWLYGTVTIDGTTWEIGSSSTPIQLDPDFDLAAFELSYECIDNLKEVLPAG